MVRQDFVTFVSYLYGHFGIRFSLSPFDGGVPNAAGFALRRHFFQSWASTVSRKLDPQHLLSV